MGIVHLAGATAVIIVSSFALVGCTASSAVTQTAADPQVLTADESTPTDEQMCWQYSDSLTLIQNMKFANDGGRLVGNEWDGIVRLAMRAIDYIPADDSTDVGKAIAALQQEIPDARSGQMNQANPELDSDTWRAGTDAVRDACNAALPEWGIEGWVGG